MKLNLLSQNLILKYSSWDSCFTHEL